VADEELEDNGQASGRPFWTGTITFGLVTIPVAIHSAIQSRGVGMRMLGPDEVPVQRRYVCSKDDEVLEADDIVRGYEIEKGKFVVITDDELEAIEPRKSREIDLKLFVDADAIEPIYFERAYFLVPTGGTNKAYRLLAEVMEKKKQAGIATFVMRAKEYLVAILAEQGILRAETLRFADEIRQPDEIGLPKVAKTTPAAVKKVETQIAKNAKKLSVREMTDDYAQRLEKLVTAKQKKKKDIVRAPEESKPEEGAEVVDLMAMLNKSLGGVRPAARKAPAAKKRKRA